MENDLLSREENETDREVFYHIDKFVQEIDSKFLSNSIEYEEIEVGNKRIKARKHYKVKKVSEAEMLLQKCNAFLEKSAYEGKLPNIKKNDKVSTRVEEERNSNNNANNNNSKSSDNNPNIQTNNNPNIQTNNNPNIQTNNNTKIQTTKITDTNTNSNNMIKRKILNFLANNLVYQAMDTRQVPFGVCRAVEEKLDQASYKQKNEKILKKKKNLPESPATSRALSSKARTVKSTATSTINVAATAAKATKTPTKTPVKAPNSCSVRLHSWKLSHINDLEEKLRQHPLALYPHLEEYIPYNVFEEVVELLDPEMKKSIDVETYVDPQRLDDFSEVFRFDPKLFGIEDETDRRERSDEKFVGGPSKEMAKKAPRNSTTEKTSPYKAIFKYDERARNKRISRLSKTKYTALEVADDEKKRTKEFCDYLETLAIDENDVVNEAMIAGYFNNGFDTKPPLSVPIEFIDVEGVPLELRRLTGGPDASEVAPEENESCRTFIDRLQQKDTEEAKKLVGKPRYRYGAWYLEPKMWKKLPKNQPLLNPKETKDGGEVKEVSSEELNSELAAMRGTKLFVDFAVACHKRKPQFLEDVVKLMPE